MTSVLPTKPNKTMQGAAPAHSSNGAANSFYSAVTGVYSSTHSRRDLPADPSLSLVRHILACLPRTDPDSPCLVDAATSHAVTRADLRRLVPSLAGGLQRRLHIRKGDVVLLLLPNSVAFPVVFLAVLAAGGVATTMNPSSTAAEIADRVRDTCPVLVLATPENVAKLPPLRAAVVLVPERFHLGGDDAPEPEFAPFHELLRSGGGGAECAAAGGSSTTTVGQDDVAAILYSSGTGGRSKGAVLTHRNLIATAELFVRFEASQYAPRRASDDVYLAALPMFHVYGLALFAVGLLALGSTVVVVKRFDAGKAAEAIGRYQVTHFPLVPPAMAALVRAAKAAVGSSPAPGLKSLVQVSSGAAPARGKLILDFLEVFPHVDFVQPLSKIQMSTALQPMYPDSNEAVDELPEGGNCLSHFASMPSLFLPLFFFSICLASLSRRSVRKDGRKNR